MSDRKSRVDPNYRPQKNYPSGNEGRLHTGMKHRGFFGPSEPLRSEDPDARAEYAARKREYEAKKAAGKFGPGMRDA